MKGTQRSSPYQVDNLESFCSGLLATLVSGFFKSKVLTVDNVVYRCCHLPNGVHVCGEAPAESGLQIPDQPDWPCFSSASSILFAACHDQWTSWPVVAPSSPRQKRCGWAWCLEGQGSMTIGDGWRVKYGNMIFTGYWGGAIIGYWEIPYG